MKIKRSTICLKKKLKKLLKGKIQQITCSRLANQMNARLQERNKNEMNEIELI